jgi:small subunit ribosomal protein S6
MEKNELVAKYELVVIVDAKLTQDVKESIRKEVAEIISKHDGRVINSQVWLEKQRLTFQIKKCGEGTYYLVNFEAKPEAVENIHSLLKLNEMVLRFAVIKPEPKAALETVNA